jgi:hypothetical protein
MIQEALDKQVHTIGIFIDLTKAYDVLNHKLLLEKLSSCGIRGTMNSWFRSYLTNRRHFIEINQSDSSNVMVNRYRSSFMEIKQGVPQGLVLGLLLFLLYIPLNIHGANLVMFTDDINVLIMDSDVGALQNKTDRVIAELETRFSRNDLVISASKTGVMSFYNRQTSFLVKPQVTFNKMNLDYISEMKFLGIHITETLKWNSHVQSLASKLRNVSFTINSLKEKMGSNMIQNIYFTKFQSLLWFGILFWGELVGELNKRILRIQKRAIRSMVGASSRTSCRQLFKDLNILTLASLYILKVTCFNLSVFGVEFQCS